MEAHITHHPQTISPTLSVFQYLSPQRLQVTHCPPRHSKPAADTWIGELFLVDIGDPPSKSSVMISFIVLIPWRVGIFALRLGNLVSLCGMGVVGAETALKTD